MTASDIKVNDLKENFLLVQNSEAILSNIGIYKIDSL